MSDYLDPNNEELLQDFFAEAEQQVENLESNILVIESDPSNHDSIDEIFRAAHTLKGGSATVEMTELATFCHDVEDLLDAMRSNAVEVTEQIVDVLLSSIDTIKVMLETRKSGSVYSEDVSPLVEKIKAFLPATGAKKKAPAAAPKVEKKAAPAPKPAVVQAPPAAAESSGGMPPVPPLTDDDFNELKAAVPDGEKLWSVNVTFDETNPMNSVGGIQVFAALKNHGSVLKTIPDFEALYEDTFYAQVVYYMSTAVSGSELEDIAFLDDVTLATDAREVLSAGGASRLSASEVAAPAPAAGPAPAAPVQQAPAVEESVP
ncbi:MAG: Hpt domain-containing protein, partial [Treponema sp.]|nr:Hpt domain-containing protein [Treponema sp.]